VSTVLYTATAVGAVIAGLLGLLRLAKTAGERLADSGPTVAPVAVRPAVAAGPGWLSDDEQAAQRWAAEATSRDLDRLAAVQRVFQHRSNQLFEWALAELLPTQAQRDVVRADLHRYHLVGAN